PEWGAIPADTPASIHRLLRRCLEKDPRKRLSSMADARLDLDEVDRPPVAPPARAAAASRGWLLPVVAAAALGALVTAIAMSAVRRGDSRDGAAGVRRTSILAPVGSTLFPDSNGVVISPDGTMVAFIIGTAARSDSNQLCGWRLVWLPPRKRVYAAGRV